jgi:hypothetical protein
MQPYQLAIMQVDIVMTDAEIIAQMRKMQRWRDENKRPAIFCTVNGFDDDPRELYEIPEVVAFAGKLVGMGYHTLLDMQHPEDLPLQPGAPYDGLSVWLLSTGRLHMGSNTVNTEEWVAALSAGLQACASTLRENTE